MVVRLSILYQEFSFYYSTFRKAQMKSIDKVEYRLHSSLIQVSLYIQIDDAIMKKNSIRLKLAYSFLLPNLDIVNDTFSIKRIS